MAVQLSVKLGSALQASSIATGKTLEGVAVFATAAEAGSFSEPGRVSGGQSPRNVKPIEIS
jgi:hypothetical protein